MNRFFNYFCKFFMNKEELQNRILKNYEKIISHSSSTFRHFNI